MPSSLFLGPIVLHHKGILASTVGDTVSAATIVRRAPVPGSVLLEHGITSDVHPVAYGVEHPICF
jgi:hypothetical protein